MNNKIGIVAIALLMTVGIAACGKKDEQAAVPAAAPTAAPAPAAPAAEAAAPAAQPATPAPAPAAPAADPDAAAKASAVQEALAEDEIASDPRGQWAVSATASSTYANDKSPASTAAYTPNMVTGMPNVERYSDNGNAWASETADKGIEWLEVKFAKPVNATGLRVRQNNAPGAIIKIELIDEGGAKHPLWAGIDDTKYEYNKIAWLDRKFDKTSYRVTGLKLTLATNAVVGWNEIDAVQIVGD
jgi:hypothetical protein